MHRRCAFLACVGCLTVLTLPATGDAPPAQAKTRSRTDRQGDPLPNGGVVRLGTERLMLPEALFLTFSPDGHYLAAHDSHEWLCVWDASCGKVLLRVRTRELRVRPPDFFSFGMAISPLVFSPDSKAIALACPKEIDIRGRPGAVRIWDIASGKERKRFDGLDGSPHCLAFSPNGRYLFASGYPLPIYRWELAEGTRKEYKTSDIVFTSESFLAVSRDGKTLMACSSDATAQLKHMLKCVRWDPATGKEIGRHSIEFPLGWAGMLSPHGDLLAVPADDGKSIALHDPVTGQERRRLHGSDYPAVVSFSPDGKAVTCSTRDGNLRVWDSATGKLRTRFKIPYPEVIWLALSPDGKRVALTSKVDDAVHVWDVATGRALHSFAGHRGGDLSLAFLKDGKEIVTVNRVVDFKVPNPIWKDWSLRRWDAATGVERVVLSPRPKGAAYHTTFSADGQRLATVSQDGRLRLWDVESGKELRSWKVPIEESKTRWTDAKGYDRTFYNPYPLITEPAFSADGKILFAAQGYKIHRWEVATGKELPILEAWDTAKERYDWWAEDAAWCLPAPDGRTLAVWSVGGRSPPFLLLDAQSGKVRQRLKITRAQKMVPFLPESHCMDGLIRWLKLIRAQLHPPAFSPDGRTIAVAETDQVTLWEGANGQPRGRLPVSGRISSLAFAPDGRFLAVGADSATPVSLWDLATNRVVGSLPAVGGRVQSLRFSPDGGRLAVAGSFSTVLVCDVTGLCDKKTLEEVSKIALPAATEISGLWLELAGADSARAYRALRRLGRSGPRGAVFLKECLKGDHTPDERHINRLIANLDDDRFATREKAFAELEKLDALVEPALRRTLQGKPSLEVRLRVQRLLARLRAKGEAPTPELVRLRVVEALEANGCKEARQLLTELAEGPQDAPLTQEARASLARLRSRHVHR